MRSIETPALPLVFRVDKPAKLYPWPQRKKDAIAIRMAATALVGMQKEGLVWNSASNDVWRMVCDEGPYLNGTDLAPFPLSFFTTGMVLSYMTEIEALARQRGIDIKDLTLVQDNRYTMDGSALKGTMVAGALPVDLSVHIDTTAGDDAVFDLVCGAVAASPASALLRDVFNSAFTLTHNGKTVPVARVAAMDEPVLADPAAVFEKAPPKAPADFPDGIIRKLKDAKETGTITPGSSLKAQQKRVLHAQGVASRRKDGLKEVDVILYNPVGSRFYFIGDDAPAFGKKSRAPSGLDYLSAGIAFCFLTQMGRFAHIAKRNIDRYAVVQDTHFSLPGASGGTGKPATASPVRTHVYVESPESLEDIQRLTDMSEQTCFLHAACRTALKTRINIKRRAKEAA